MDRNETSQQKLARVADEIGSAIRQQARGRWADVRTAERSSDGRHVWRFRPGAGEPDRFLHLSHRAMTEGTNPAGRVLRQLTEAHWLDRLTTGPETSFVLAPSGRLRARGPE